MLTKQASGRICIDSLSGKMLGLVDTNLEDLFDHKITFGYLKRVGFAADTSTLGALVGHYLLTQ